MNIIFVDHNKEFISYIKKLFASHANIKCIVDNIQNIKKDNVAFVSPSNSLGYFDGGVDAIYMKMFPNIQSKVQKRIKELNLTTALGRYYLPVGSAISIQVANNTYLISAPTMFLPHDVSKTRNAYHAFMAAICLFSKLNIQTLVCPALCTGYGKMPIDIAANQIYSSIL